MILMFLNENTKNELILKIEKREIRNCILFMSSNYSSSLVSSSDALSNSSSFRLFDRNFTKRLKMVEMNRPNKLMDLHLKNQPHLKRTLQQFMSFYRPISTIGKNPRFLNHICEALASSGQFKIGELYEDLVEFIFGDIQFPLCKIVKDCLKRVCPFIYNSRLNSGNDFGGSGIDSKSINSIELMDLEKIFDDVIKKSMINKGEHQLKNVLNVLIKLGIMEVNRNKKDEFCFVFQDVLDYYIAMDKSVPKGMNKFSALTLFCCFHLRTKRTGIFDMFYSLFGSCDSFLETAKEKQIVVLVDRSSEVCLFLNQLDLKDNQVDLHKIFENKKEELLIILSRSASYELFDFFLCQTGDRILNGELVDHCLVVSVYNDVKIVEYFLKKKLSLMKTDNRIRDWCSEKEQDILDLIEKISGNITIEEDDILSLVEENKMTIVEIDARTGEDGCEDKEYIQRNVDNFFEVLNRNKDSMIVCWVQRVMDVGFNYKTVCYEQLDLFGRSFLYTLIKLNKIELIRGVFKRRDTRFPLIVIEKESFLEACRQHYTIEILLLLLENITCEQYCSYIAIETPEICYLHQVKDRTILSVLIARLLKEEICIDRVLLEAIKQQRECLVLELMRIGVDASCILDGSPLFHQLFRNKRVNCVIFGSIMQVVDVNTKNSKGQNCFHLACQSEQWKLLEELEKHEVSMNEIDSDGFRPLDYVESVDKFSVLIERGLRPNKDGWAFLLKRVFLYMNQQQRSRLMSKSERRLVEFLITGLHVSKNKEVLKLLVENDVDCSIVEFLVEKALKDNNDFLCNQKVFDILFNGTYQFVLLEKMPVIDSKLFLANFKGNNNKIENNTIKFLYQLFENRDDLLLNDIKKGLSRKKIVYIQQVEKNFEMKERELTKKIIDFKRNITLDYEKLEYKQSIVGVRNIVFIDAHGKSRKSQLTNKWIVENVLNSIGNSLKESWLQIKNIDLDSETVEDQER